jgi:hypothetical protein
MFLGRVAITELGRTSYKVEKNQEFNFQHIEIEISNKFLNRDETW